MRLTEAIERADSEHVVTFLLAAYIETLHFYDGTRRALPAQVKYLPLAGKSDVIRRLQLLRGTLDACVDDRASRPIIEEAIEVFAAACSRLRVLEGETAHPVSAAQAPGIWRRAPLRLPDFRRGEWAVMGITGGSQRDEIRIAARYRALGLLRT